MIYKISRLRNKLLLSVAAISIVMTLVSMLAVSWVISHQYLNQSSALLQKASAVISDELEGRKNIVLITSRQLATQKNLGSTLWYLGKYGKSSIDREMLFVTYLQLARDTQKLGRVAKLSQIAIYDSTGNLVSFALHDKGREQAGFVRYLPAPIYRAATMQEGEELGRQNLSETGTVAGINASYSGKLPQRESAHYALVNGKLSIESHVPIMGASFDPESGTQQTRQLGLVVAAQPLDQVFADYLSRLTDVKINVFSQQGYSSGNMPAYQMPDWRDGAQTTTGERASIFNEITIEGQSFYQSLIPLYNDKLQVGAIAALNSHEVVRNNTLEMIYVLGLVAVVSVLLTFPLAWYFANSISQPLTNLSRIFLGIANGKRAGMRAEELGQLENEMARHDELGDLTYSFIAMDDAVRQKIQQIKEINATLESKIEARTAELEQAKEKTEAANSKLTEQNALLEKINEKLETASRTKSEFLANMSHEIRTPMNSILGMAHLALNTEADPRQRDYLEKIHASGVHLLGIIDEILDFSKIDAGKLQLEIVDFDLQGIMKTLNTLIAEKAKEKGLQLDFELDPSIPFSLNGDRRRISQVLINYASNAVKFTASGRIAVRATRLDENENGVLLCFEVQDSGIGISDKDKARLFNPFQQIDTSNTRNFEGTGLGLAISRQLVEMMPEGKVGVDSVEGKGSTFWFVVRLARGSAHYKAENVSAINFFTGALRLQGARILLAENNQFNQQVATEFLENAGATVCIAQNGKEALDLLLKDHFDCVLMDLQMPVMDGYEATRLIRDNPVLAAIPVIAMTANATEEDRERCLDAGMDDFISKPFKPFMLSFTIAKWLAKPSHPPLLAEPHEPMPEGENGANETDLLDMSTLAELVDGNKEKMLSFAQKFLLQARGDMREIDAALNNRDMAMFATLGHHNIGPASIVGARRFADLCKALVKQGESEWNQEQAQDIVSQMHTMLDRISAQIDEYFA